MLEGYISILGNRKKVWDKRNVTDFPWNTVLLVGKNASYTYQHKSGIEWLKDERPSDIFNFRCSLPKADFRFFYFKLETLLNKLVKLCSSPFLEK